jgi:hypothetical protein
VIQTRCEEQQWSMDSESPVYGTVANSTRYV